MQPTDREPVSVLLPTVEWTSACDQLATQLRDGDELFLICDTDADPIAGRDTPDGVRILTAGEPEGCSGKANAIAHGLEQASHDRLVWTDADFDRNDEWLDQLVTAGRRHGPVAAIPFWYGNGAWSLLEPWGAVFSTLAMYLRVGNVGRVGWGGGLTFTRDELDMSVATLAEDLRRVVSDDALVSRHLGEIYPVRSMVTPVPVASDVETTIARAIRFNRLTHVNEGMTGELFVSLLAVGIAIAFPVVVAPLATLFVGGVYAALGIRRPTFLLAYPGLFLAPMAVLAGIFVSEFDWAGRRYRLNGQYDVEVIDQRLEPDSDD